MIESYENSLKFILTDQWYAWHLTFRIFNISTFGHTLSSKSSFPLLDVNNNRALPTLDSYCHHVEHVEKKNSQHGVKVLQCSKQSTALFHGLYHTRVRFRKVIKMSVQNAICLLQLLTIRNNFIVNRKINLTLLFICVSFFPD